MANSRVLPSPPLARQAVMDLRPSPPPPALSPQESRPLPSARTERPPARGWPRAARAVIDIAGGRTAATTQDREGFQALGGPGPLGEVGLLGA